MAVAGGGGQSGRVQIMRHRRRAALTGGVQAGAKAPPRCASAMRPRSLQLDVFGRWMPTFRRICGIASPAGPRQAFLSISTHWEADEDREVRDERGISPIRSHGVGGL